MVVPEPAHLVGVPKACPRCGSFDTKWRYYNNGKISQPRYECRDCENLFTFGGKFRLTLKERAAMRKAQGASRAQAGPSAPPKKKGRQIKATPAQRASSSDAKSSSSSDDLRPPNGLQLGTNSRPKRKKTCIPDSLPEQFAAAVSKAKGIRGGGIRLRLTTGSALELPGSTSSDEPEPHEVAAGADMIEPEAELKEHFAGHEDMVGGFVDAFGGDSESCVREPEPRLEMVVYGGAGLGSGPPGGWSHEMEAGCSHWMEAVEASCSHEMEVAVQPDVDGPAFSWTSSEQLRSPIATASCAESELEPQEAEFRFIDADMLRSRDWEDFVRSFW